jgi:hypothetical protein
MLNIAGLCGKIKCTNSMQKIPSCEARRHELIHEFTNILRNPKVYLCSQESATGP